MTTTLSALQHLKAAANADDLRNLVETQIELIPDNANRIKEEAREALDIVRGAGSEIRDIVKVTIDELRGRKPVAKKAPAATRSAAVAVEKTDNQVAA